MLTNLTAVATASLLFSFATIASAEDGAAGLRGRLFPETIPLPNGFQPEGVTAHRLTVLAGSLLDGDIYQASVVTGEGRIVVDAPEGRTAIGIKADEQDRLFVAGGPTGQAYVYDLRTGASLAAYTLTTTPTNLVNDVILAPRAAYFTDSFNPVLYRLPLGPRAALPASDAAQTIQVTGPAAEDFVAGEIGFNGIAYSREAGGTLIVVNFTRGTLYRIDPETGVSGRIDLGGDTVEFGDGIVLSGRTLYVVQNQLNAIAEVRLDARLTAGEVVDVITDPRFQIPTTADIIGPYLFAVNARFDVAPPPLPGTPPSDPNLTFDIVRVRR